MQHILGKRCWEAIRILVKGERKIPRRNPYFEYDEKRFLSFSGCADSNAKDSRIALITAHYHVIEKGLTMPGRRLKFGKEMVSRLCLLIDQFESEYGQEEPQVQHAIGVLKEYWHLHKEAGCIQETDEFWRSLTSFVKRRPSVAPSSQHHSSKKKFYEAKDAAFPLFAMTRRTLRHYATQPLNKKRLERAVDVARFTPSSCNRQPCRVHCVSDRQTMERILELQGGNRGFGHLADCILVVTSDLACVTNLRERTDPFVNGGMFLMTLSYALYHEEVAHCILNWSRSPEEDINLRNILKIKESETVIAIVSCGETPETIDYADSPRKPLSSVFILH